jgi:hypothetical protein
MDFVDLVFSKSGPAASFRAGVRQPRIRPLCGALAGLIGVALGGCATNVTLHYDGHPSGAAVEVREVARDTYLLAQLAHNAYSKEEFKLPSHVTEPDEFIVRDDANTGFAVRTYWVRPANRQPYVVIAFRGTQFSSLADWKYGNLSDRQYLQGLRHFQKVRANVPAGTEIIVTGHSLGGAIATSISLNEENTKAYGFDASLRVRRGRAVHNWREYVSQHGEILAALRAVLINPYGRYTMINCPGGGGGPISRHDMRTLAACLTRIAASDGDKTAEWSRGENSLGSTEGILKSPHQPTITSEQWRN